MNLIVIGGGIVGLAAAFQVSRQLENLHLILLEKEGELAAHQTGRNSGVLHSGIYYKPGTLRAANCRSGKLAMERFCVEEGIPFDRCGKIIVATSAQEYPALERIYRRGVANGVDCRLIDRAALVDLEPYCAGLRGIHVPEAGIIDYRAVCGRLADILKGGNHEIRLNTRVVGLDERPDGIVVQTTKGELQADYALNCTGLHSDRTAAMAGARINTRIIPFRGEYYELMPEAQHLCRGLIYPVPDDRFPFLGVHLTRMISGGVECGPNAVLALAREGYGKADINFKDLWDAVSYVGFRRLAAKYWRMGAEELYRSFSKRAFVGGLQRLVPEIQAEHLLPAPSGIRAQAVTPAGDLVDDFVFYDTARMVHVLNAASPAATAAFNVGQLIADRLARRIDGS